MSNTPIDTLDNGVAKIIGRFGTKVVDNIEANRFNLEAYKEAYIAAFKECEGDLQDLLSQEVQKATTSTIERISEHFDADGVATHAYIQEYLATLNKELK